VVVKNVSLLLKNLALMAAWIIKQETLNKTDSKIAQMV
jgi:hypothetical protein